MKPTFIVLKYAIDYYKTSGVGECLNYIESNIQGFFF